MTQFAYWEKGVSERYYCLRLKSFEDCCIHEILCLLLFMQVYLMRDKVKRNFVCVTIIKIKNIPKKEREATKVEVDLLRRLNHPNIVRYIDSFLSKNKESLCICMEYCDGVSEMEMEREHTY